MPKAEKSIEKQVLEQMLIILAEYPGGLRAMDLKHKIHEKLPDVLLKTIGAPFAKLTRMHPDKLVKYEKGKGTSYALANKSAVDSKGEHINLKTIQSEKKPASKSKATRVLDPKFKTARVLKQMSKILTEYPEGLQLKNLQEMIHKELPDVFPHSIRSMVSALTDEYHTKFARTKEKGAVFYSLLNAENSSAESVQEQPAIKEVSQKTEEITQDTKEGESKLYKPFAEFLKILDECYEAIPCGNKIRSPLGKWSNPDVIGVLRQERGQHVSFPDEIVSAEIKISKDKNEIFNGFGQACAYRLFSHKVYLVIPKSDAPYMVRLQSMCHLIGLGLVVFSYPNGDAKNPVFEVQLRARKQDPDMFYVNDVISGEIANDLYR